MSKPTIDLRARPAATTTRTTTQRIGPLRPGTILTTATPLTEAERAVLARAGAVLPPPEAVGAGVVAQAKAQLAKEPAAVCRTDAAPLVMPEPVPMEALPEEQQAEMLQGLSAYREALARPGEYPDIRPAKTEPAPAGTPTDPATVVPASSAAPEKHFCAHCGWDQARPDEDVDEQDKLVFLQSVLGMQRYRKAYRLLGGRLTVVFRTLTAAESDACFTQAAYDNEGGGIVDAGQYFRTVHDYRLCLGLAHIDYGQKKFDLPEMDGYQTDPPPKNATKLKQIVPFVYDRVLIQESVRRACALAYYRFQRLVERLEARVDDPNFWPAIEGQP